MCTILETNIWPFPEASNVALEISRLVDTSTKLADVIEQNSQASYGTCRRGSLMRGEANTYISRGKES